MSGFNDKLNKKAVALRYDVDKNIAPVIVASGMGHVAEKIIEIAGENKVPIYEDTSLIWHKKNMPFFLKIMIWFYVRLF